MVQTAIEFLKANPLILALIKILIVFVVLVGHCCLPGVHGAQGPGFYAGAAGADARGTVGIASAYR